MSKCIDLMNNLNEQITKLKKDSDISQGEVDLLENLKSFILLKEKCERHTQYIEEWFGDKISMDLKTVLLDMMSDIQHLQRLMMRLFLEGEVDKLSKIIGAKVEIKSE